MRFLKQIMGAIALGVALLLGSGLLASPAQAGYVVTLMEQNGNVVASGSGAIDLALLHPDPFNPVVDVSILIWPAIGAIRTGETSGNPRAEKWEGDITGPTNFGSGPNNFVNIIGDGDIVGIVGTAVELNVPEGYSSGQSLSSNATFLGATFSSLGVIPGKYEWMWGPGSDQNFTLQIGPAAAVPEPSSFLLLGGALAGLLFMRVRRRSLDVG